MRKLVWKHHHHPKQCSDPVVNGVCAALLLRVLLQISCAIYSGVPEADIVHPSGSPWGFVSWEGFTFIMEQ